MIIVPIFRSGCKNDPANYRGISLINVNYEIISSIINDRIQTWAENQALIDESQSGFRSGNSVTDNLLCLQSIVQKYISKQRGPCYVLFIDFQKAFDSVVDFKLFSSLADKGLKGKL